MHLGAFSLDTDVNAELIGNTTPAGSEFQVLNSARYLGFFLGPGAGDDSWKAPCAKFMTRVRSVAALKLNVQGAIRAYNVYAFSVFGICSAVP